MERHKSALKAARQAVKRQARNQSARSSFRSAIKKFQGTLEKVKASSKSVTKEQVFAELNKVQSVLMKAASKNLIHSGNASRRISRLSAAAHKALSA